MYTTIQFFENPTKNWNTIKDSGRHKGKILYCTHLIIILYAQNRQY